MGTPPDTIRIQTADNVSLGYTTAGVGSRMVAQLIDNALALVIVFAVVEVVLMAGTSTSSSAQGAEWAGGAAVGAGFLAYFAYFLVAELISGGRTPGKAAMGVRVVRLDGSAADFGAVLVRNLVRIVDLIFCVGLLVMFFNPLSRRLGDMAAGTVVIRERTAVTLAAVAAPPPLILRTPDAGPAIDGVERLGAHEENALRVFLSRQGLAPPLRAHLAAQLAVKLYERLQLPWSAPERMWPPELFLERLYLQLSARGR